MITKMLARGLSPEVISEITGLEVEKIAEIDLQTIIKSLRGYM